MKLKATNAVVLSFDSRRFPARLRTCAHNGARAAAGLRMVWALDRAGQTVMHWERQERPLEHSEESTDLEWAHPLGLIMRIAAWVSPRLRGLRRLAGHHGP